MTERQTLWRQLRVSTTSVGATADGAAVGGWPFRRLPPSKQPGAGAWGVSAALTEPPSPTFSAMERAASAAAMVAARLFDTEVAPLHEPSLLTLMQHRINTTCCLCSDIYPSGIVAGGRHCLCDSS